MKGKKKSNIKKTNFWTNRGVYSAKRSAQSFLNPNNKDKVVANNECLSGCNNSCGTECATGCSDF